MIHDVGECSLDAIDDANVPVTIFVSRVDEDDIDEYPDLEGQVAWTLTASNFMPRKGVVCEGAYRLLSDDRDELVAAFQQRALPVYKDACTCIARLDKADADGESYLYYWSAGAPA